MPSTAHTGFPPKEVHYNNIPSPTHTHSLAASVFILFFCPVFGTTVGKIDFSIHSLFSLGFLRNYVTAQPTSTIWGTVLPVPPQPLLLRILHALFTLSLSTVAWPLLCFCVYRFSQLHKVPLHVLTFDFQALQVFSHTHSWFNCSPPPTSTTPTYHNPQPIRRTHFATYSQLFFVLFFLYLSHWRILKRIRFACSIFNNTLCAFAFLFCVCSCLFCFLVRTRTRYPYTGAQCDKCVSECVCKRRLLSSPTRYYLPTRRVNETCLIYSWSRSTSWYSLAGVLIGLLNFWIICSIDTNISQEKWFSN